MAFLENGWYAAAWCDEMGPSPVGRTILSEPVVLFRDEQQRLKAVGGRCPHRFAPLAKGRLVGSTLECPYHGLRFDGEGKCVFNPHGNRVVPAAAKVRSFPVVERHRLVWLWTGKDGKQNPSLIPDFGFVDHDDWATVTGSIGGQGHYELFSDNILDLGHAAFIHQQTVGAPSFLYSRRKMYRSGTTVHSNFFAQDDLLSPVLAKIFDKVNVRVDATVEVQWTAPANLLLTHYVHDVGTSPSDEQCLRTFHVFTPETEESTHYFWAVSRKYRASDQALSKAIAEGSQATFEHEDKPMISAQQELMGGREFWSLKPVLLQGDTAGVLARRLLEKAVADERIDKDDDGVARNRASISNSS